MVQNNNSSQKKAKKILFEILRLSIDLELLKIHMHIETPVSEPVMPYGGTLASKVQVLLQSNA